MVQQGPADSTYILCSSEFPDSEYGFILSYLVELSDLMHCLHLQLFALILPYTL